MHEYCVAFFKVWIFSPTLVFVIFRTAHWSPRPESWPKSGFRSPFMHGFEKSENSQHFKEPGLKLKLFVTCSLEIAEWNVMTRIRKCVFFFIVALYDWKFLPCLFVVSCLLYCACLQAWGHRPRDCNKG